MQSLFQPFGAGQQQQQPQQQQQQQQQPLMAQGQSTPTSLFGTSQQQTPQQTQQSPFQSSQPSLFQPNQTSQTSLFQPSQTSQSSSLFQTQPANQSSIFQTPQASQPSFFSTNATPQQSLFQTNANPSQSLFQSNPSGQSSLFQPAQQQQQQQQQQQPSSFLQTQQTIQQQQQQQTQQMTHEQEQQQKQQREQMLQMITQPKIYNDARDKILGDFNKVQALWGTGKAYYSHTAQPVDLAESQPVGFHCLSERYKLQQQETQQQRSRLQQLSEQLSELQKHVAAIKSKLDECRRKRVVLGNRVLKVLIMQEIENRKGFPIQADEEKLRSRMENILSELHCQTKYRGCLNELMSQLKQIQSQQHRTPQVHLDEAVVEDIKEHLKNEHNAIEHLINVIKQDKKYL